MKTIPEVLQILSRVPGIEKITYYQAPKSFRVDFQREGEMFGLLVQGEINEIFIYVENGRALEKEILSAAETVKMVRAALEVPPRTRRVEEEFLSESDVEDV